MVSFDVESLFTNIPLEESIDLTIHYIVEGNHDLKLSKPNLKQLFLFATAQTHFSFNGNFYDQIDGVAMVSPRNHSSQPFYGSSRKDLAWTI